jgi:hypothetical protein
LLDQNILSKIKPESGVEAIKALQEYTLTSLFAGDRAVRLMETGLSAKNYTLDDLFTDLENAEFGQRLKLGKALIFTVEICKKFTLKN